jgi:glycogen debranching enzyme
MKQKLTARLKVPVVKPLLPPALALMSVSSKSGKGVYASSDTLFKGAIFGRDSIEVAEDLLQHKPRLVRRILLTLASLQGEVRNDVNEEEPGKIIHEYRTMVVDGKRLKGTPRHIFEELSARWGGNQTELAYYGSVDATPHFMRLLVAYRNKYGDKILREKVTLRSGHKLSMLLVFENCLDWLQSKQDESHAGFIEYQRRNPHGIVNQVWKDSNEFYAHESGEPANHDRPIASIEVQGLAYDAFMAAASLLPDKAEELQVRAHRLRDSVVNYLWLDKEQYFALGIDYDDAGRQRVIRTRTANPAALLDTAIFDDMPDIEKRQFITAIIKTIMSPDFLTDAGIRSRALSAADLVDFWDYHGSYSSWPKETYDIAKGMRRQGFPDLARELENRLLNVILKNREYPEFVYVDEWGRVLASSPSAHEHGEVVLVDSTNNPERAQAWTISAVMAIVARRLAAKVLRPRRLPQELWQIELERRTLTHIPRVNRLFNPLALSAKYPTYKYRLGGKGKRSAGPSSGKTKKSDE